MEEEKVIDHNEECCHMGHHRGKGHNHCRRKAKTFRRARAINFWGILEQKRKTLKKQLETPELQSINPVIVGELKAIDMVMDEFKRVFELYEVEEEWEGTAENSPAKETRRSENGEE